MPPEMNVPSVKATRTSLPGVLLLEPRVFEDDRGFVMESYNQTSMTTIGIYEGFVQDNHSFSRRNVLRGLHYQVKAAHGKLVRVVMGEIFDVAVDVRRGSPTFGKWHGVLLSGENKQMLWIPPGCAHGFLALSESTHVFYKTTGFYAPELERTIAWNDSDLAIPWQLSGPPILSARDSKGTPFRDAEVCV
jgi:dTDP-4-dehydrorhamnose 3,5-epimerase